MRSHNVVAKGKWIAFVSTTVETHNPEEELAPGEISLPLRLPDLMLQ
jgi:RAB protein geranylgeranyltransferase component A